MTLTFMSKICQNTKLFVYTADEPWVGKRGPFWNTCTRAHCNLVTPLLEIIVVPIPISQISIECVIQVPKLTLKLLFPMIADIGHCLGNSQW